MFTEFLSFLHRVVLSNLLRTWFNIIYGKGNSVTPTKPSNKIIRCSAVNLAGRIRRKEISSYEVVTAFIDRIGEINPSLNCVVDERYKIALQDATIVDELVSSGKYTEEQLACRFPLLGVPFSTKDHMAVKDMIYTCGIWHRRNIRSDVDGDAIACMRNAGAIPFVLTNVPELCLAFETNNQIHGRTCNPYDSNRIAGGSSGGEGSLISSCGSPIGIGTDLGGSIRMPSFFNGIFGHKPSAFIVSTRGTFPETHGKLNEFSGVGPMSRFAEDLLPTLKIITGEKATLLRLDDPVDISALNIFYQKTHGGSLFCSNVQSDIQVAVDRAVHHFEGIGVVAHQTKIQYLKENFDIISSYYNTIDIVSAINDGKGLNRLVELFKILFGWSRHTLHSLKVIPLFKGKSFTFDPILKSKEEKLFAQFEAMLGTDGVFLFPTHPTVASYHSEPILHFGNISYTTIANLLGLPSTAVPMGIGRGGLPIGLQVIAGRNQDRLCLAVAKELETAFGGWREPGTI